MSAFIVSDHHINALMTYALSHRISYWCEAAARRIEITSVNAEEVGRILMDENVRSVAHRYENRLDADELNAAAAYRFALYPHILSAVEAIKACDCLSYQSCETPDWERSLAWRILHEIRASAHHRLPGYNAAPWEIASHNWKEACAR